MTDAEMIKAKEIVSLIRQTYEASGLELDEFRWIIRGVLQGIDSEIEEGRSKDEQSG